MPAPDNPSLSLDIADYLQHSKRKAEHHAYKYMQENGWLCAKLQGLKISLPELHPNASENKGVKPSETPIKI